MCAFLFFYVLFVSSETGRRVEAVNSSLRWNKWPLGDELSARLYVRNEPRRCLVQPRVARRTRVAGDDDERARESSNAPSQVGTELKCRSVRVRHADRQVSVHALGVGLVCVWMQLAENSNWMQIKKEVFVWSLCDQCRAEEKRRLSCKCAQVEHGHNTRPGRARAGRIQTHPVAALRIRSFQKGCRHHAFHSRQEFRIESMSFICCYNDDVEAMRERLLQSHRVAQLVHEQRDTRRLRAAAQSAQRAQSLRAAEVAEAIRVRRRRGRRRVRLERPLHGRRGQEQSQAGGADGAKRALRGGRGRRGRWRRCSRAAAEQRGRQDEDWVRPRRGGDD